MAYPLEQEHKDYMDYVIATQSEGNKALPKEEWRKKRKKEQEEEMASNKPKLTSMSEF